MSDDTPRRRKGVGPVSLSEVAVQAGVSISTVSRIVNGETRRASPETLARVREAIRTVGYHPNQLGRALRSRESRLVAMLAANLDNPVMATLAASTEAALREAGYTMILCDTHDRPELQDDYLNAMRSQVVQGYVMVAAQPSAGLRDFVERGAPMVFVSRRSPFGTCAFVGPDNLAAGAAAADYLLDRGIDAPAVVFPSRGSSTTRERVQGFCERAAARGLSADRIRQVEAPGISHLEIGYAAAAQFAAPSAWPRGAMCISDQVAYGVHRVARENGIRVPGDCELVGIDGNPINAWLAPWLTSVKIPHQDFGPAIVDLMLSLWGGEAPRERLMPHRMAAALET
ncbi:LacI family DNA-binding transcriptional regulator [Polaromonas aquatica]|uniref:LacI family DNA-binding transcriptional regulator n=1 Tax=Polaromonas aquatica TaxID=332657 RepID=UPI003D65E125